MSLFLHNVKGVGPATGAAHRNSQTSVTTMQSSTDSEAALPSHALFGIPIWNPRDHGIEGQPLMVPAHLCNAAIEELAVALKWAMEKEPSPCRCLDFATPPHVCVAHKALSKVLLNDKIHP